MQLGARQGRIAKPGQPSGKVRHSCPSWRRIRLRRSDEDDSWIGQLLKSFKLRSASMRINLNADIFGERKFAQLFIAECSNSGEILGYALAFDEFWPSGRGVCLEDVFVQPAHRGKGVCSALFSAVARDSLYNRRCHFMSLCYLAWNSAALDVYRHYGFVDITGSDSSKSNGAHFLRLSRDQFRSALGQAL
uniref:N-acetyltransferase domain-containing protein n=1 Tax=Macrostomum lignano TaxID=282301 RepID=A0A1I8FFM4_9PLAT